MCQEAERACFSLGGPRRAVLMHGERANNARSRRSPLHDALFGDCALYTLDISIPLAQIGVSRRLARSHNFLARVVLQRASEGMQFAGLDGITTFLGKLLDVG